MKQSDSQQILKLLTRLTEELVGPAKPRSRTGAKRTLSERLDNLDTKVTRLDKKLGTSQQSIPIAIQLDALDRKVEHRFDVVNHRIDTARDQVIDLVTRVHEETTKRVVDLEEPATGREG